MTTTFNCTIFQNIEESCGLTKKGLQSQINPIQYHNWRKRPCKIWAPYGGYFVEENLAPKSNYVDSHKPG